MMPCRLKISGMIDGFSSLSERNHQMPDNLVDGDADGSPARVDNSIGREMVTCPSCIECRETRGGSSNNAMLLPGWTI